ncbi:MAG: hypothetical protein IIA87_04955 [Nanoarchaeota archaeon]|nr:hypothetical protein [Nanoarchaeota archaeon]
MNFSQIIILIVGIAISIIAIRISFKFDLNKHLENRRKIRIDQLKNICPHGRITKVNKKFGFEPYFVSPIGTMDYICSQCNAVLGEEDVNRINEIYLKNPELVLRKHKEFIKKAKKLKIF